MPAAARAPAASAAVVAVSVVLAGAACRPRSSYPDAAARIAAASRADTGAWDKLAYLTDEIGPRLAGSPALERAVAWARDTFVRDGEENVTLEPVRVPRWVRGAESAELLAPVQRKLAVLALGGSVGTPPDGITADVAVVSSFEELDKLGRAVAGKIVLLDRAMPAGVHPGMAYGQTLPFRRQGATRAGRLGAAAVLVRSLATGSLGAPHTGDVRYAADGSPRIPAAAISVEDAALLARLARRGDAVTVRLTLGAQSLPDADSANVIAELAGRERPDEVVVIGAHLDSWDVGQGAQDDGAGCAIVMEALATLRQVGLVPRRTVRAVLFTNEENGVRGGEQYAKDHAAELPRHVAAFEVDSGAGAPLGFMTDGPQPWSADARRVGRLLAPIGAGTVIAGHAGDDIMKLKPAGVPLMSLMLDPSHYFDVHHSVADTLEKVDPENLRRGVAALATMAYVVADRPESFRGGRP
jgi:hypothetical protein